jgi:hypothetical protein
MAGFCSGIEKSPSRQASGKNGAFVSFVVQGFRKKLPIRSQIRNLRNAEAPDPRAKRF